jgi:hypothetical protein
VLGARRPNEGNSARAEAINAFLERLPLDSPFIPPPNPVSSGRINSGQKNGAFKKFEDLRLPRRDVEEHHRRPVWRSAIRLPRLNKLRADVQICANTAGEARSDPGGCEAALLRSKNTRFRAWELSARAIGRLEWLRRRLQATCQKS